MSIKLEMLKEHLRGLTFACVTKTVTKEENLISFRNKRGFTTFAHGRDFRAHREVFTNPEWERAERAYEFYYGFSISPTGDIHFDSRGRALDPNFAHLGIETLQNRSCPPRRRSWIVGRLEVSGRLHFWDWVLCTEAEMLFVKFLREGKTRFSSDDLRRLCVSRHISEGESTNRLLNMAMLLLARNLEYFLDLRMQHGANCADPQVYEICMEYDRELWDEYKQRALAQKLDRVLKYSELIPEPREVVWTPSQPVVEERRRVSSGQPAVSFFAPYQALQI